MTVYLIIDKGANGRIKIPTRTWNTEQFISQHYDFYLTGEFSNAGRRYRLHSRHPHRADDFLPYEIRCPDCGYEMKCIGGPKSLFQLGLYECRCSK